MKQLILDFFLPPQKVEVQKVAKAQGSSKDHHVFIAPNGCKITMDGTTVLYEDGLEPYKEVFKNIKEAFESFTYWCNEEKKASKTTKKVAH